MGPDVTRRIWQKNILDERVYDESSDDGDEIPLNVLHQKLNFPKSLMFHDYIDMDKNL